MRFPNQGDVKKACYNDKMTLRSCRVVVKIVPWSANVGAKGVMEVSWVRVANVPLERRNERNVAYVASLVGVPLEIDMDTLHKPEYVRVRLGCRNVDELPGVAEAVLGTHFFDFFYDIEKILIRDPERSSSVNQVESAGKDSSHGKHFARAAPRDNEKRKEGGIFMNDKDERNSPRDSGEKEQEESDETADDTLLIESIAREACEKEKLGGSQALLVVNNDRQNVDEIQVEEMMEDDTSKAGVRSEYTVQFPVSSEEMEEVIPTPPLRTEDELRFSTRNMQNMGDKIQDRAVAISRKRNLEGNCNFNSFDVLSNSDLMIRASKMGVIIHDDNFSSIDILRELERVRRGDNNSNHNSDTMSVEKTMFITNGKGDKTPISTDWADGEEDLEEDFIPVRSRKKRTPKIQVAIPRPLTRSQKPDLGMKYEKSGSPVYNTRATRRERKKKPG
ncbi:hypothetical protein VPH35_108020 [Triticum aestivum]